MVLQEAAVDHAHVAIAVCAGFAGQVQDRACHLLFGAHTLLRNKRAWHHATGWLPLSLDELGHVGREPCIMVSGVANEKT